ncbi:hypothetical protein THMIRHAM_00810 [Thiomicrorhabdus immobilis]|uniref:Endonuclease n=1 Tax=Thiomicrorhabdus immobilis TaxID=2791037 RepID=A0ABM7MAE8_9GAMM|nr:DNA/RNA non-specific endonuclease [Thiomicrorhabdus immobilis]BCN92296.1 hypothetical protein THMIRHAM_00810 [Thiomicrorhabdus immobilis]
MRQSALTQIIRPLLNLLIKNPKFLIIVPLVGGLWYGYEVMVARPAMTYMGVPQVNAAPPQTGIMTGFSHILRNQGYMLEYSETLKNPLWVTYKVGKKKYSSGKRPSGFSRDWRSIASIGHDDYTGSGYDRGHMAPNYVIASRYGRSAQLETFLMTNITPQKPNLNQKSWQRLEEVIANDFSEWQGEFWVVTGPIFDGQPKTLKNSGVKIPKAFYKILIKPTTPERPATALAFVFPQNAKANASLMSFVSTIDEIEAQTGIDFFSELEDDFEDRLESRKTPEAWRLQEVANRPSRY